MGSFLGWPSTKLQKGAAIDHHHQQQQQENGPFNVLLKKNYLLDNDHIHYRNPHKYDIWT